MDKKRIELIITICLIAVFIMAAGNGVRAIAKKRRMSAGSAALPAMPKPAAVTQAPADKPQAAGQEQEEEYTVERDPFTRQAATEGRSAKAKAKEAAFLLTGIIYDKDNPDGNYCIVNGEVLKLGESTDGFIVTVISEDSVVLTSEKENKDYKISLWNE